MLFEGCDLAQCFSLLHVAVSSTSFTYTFSKTYTYTYTYTYTCACVYACACVFLCVGVCVCVCDRVGVLCVCGRERRDGVVVVVMVGGWVLCLSFPPLFLSGELELNSFIRESE